MTFSSAAPVLPVPHAHQQPVQCELPSPAHSIFLHHYRAQRITAPLTAKSFRDGTLGIWRVGIGGIVVGKVRVGRVRRSNDRRCHEYSPKKEATIVKCPAWEESAMRKEATMGEEAGVGKEARMRAKAHVRSAAKALRRREASEQNAQETDNAEYSRHRYQHRKSRSGR